MTEQHSGDDAQKWHPWRVLSPAVWERIGCMSVILMFVVLIPVYLIADLAFDSEPSQGVATGIVIAIVAVVVLVGLLAAVSPDDPNAVPTKCPKCGKGFKTGYTTCRACGYEHRAAG